MNLAGLKGKVVAGLIGLSAIGGTVAGAIKVASPEVKAAKEAVADAAKVLKERQAQFTADSIQLSAKNPTLMKEIDAVGVNAKNAAKADSIASKDELAKKYLDSKRQVSQAQGDLAEAQGKDIGVAVDVVTGKAKAQTTLLEAPIEAVRYDLQRFDNAHLKPVRDKINSSLEEMNKKAEKFDYDHLKPVHDKINSSIEEMNKSGEKFDYDHLKPVRDKINSSIEEMNKSGEKFNSAIKQTIENGWNEFSNNMTNWYNGR